MFINPTFDPSLGIVQDADIFMPKDWLVGYTEGPFEGIQAGQCAHVPEATILNEWMGLEPAFFPSDSYTWKIFVRNCLYAWFGPREILNLPAGTYTASVLVWPKLHMLDNGDPPGDLWAGEVGLRLGEDPIQWKSGLAFDKYNLLEWHFEHGSGLLPLYFHFKGKYPIDNSFFFHYVKLVGEESSQPGRIAVDLYVPQETRDWVQSLLISPVPEPDPPAPIPFTVFNQRDEPWASDHLGTSPYTIGGSGCALVSTTNFASIVAADINPRIHNRLISAANGYTSDGRLKWAVAGQVVDGMDFVAYRTYRGEPKPPADLTYIAVCLEEGLYLSVQVDYITDTPKADSHFVSVVAPVIINSELIDLIIADPYHGDVVSLMERYGKGTLRESIYAVASYRISQTYIRAVHDAPINGAPDDLLDRVTQYKSLGVSMVKLLHNGDPRKVDLARTYLGYGIEPIVRIYDNFAGENRALATAKTMIAVGVRKFEVMNEPNIEWPGVSWQVPEDVARVAQVWFEDASSIIKWGGNPAFPAMAPTERGGVNGTYSGVRWVIKILDWLKIHHEDTIRSWLAGGRLWGAIHLLPFNKPFDWNPVQPWGIDDMCLGYYTAYQDLWGDFGHIQIISTEGGVVSPDHMKYLGWPSDGERVFDSEGQELYNNDTWGNYTLSMYQWLQRHGGPPVCTWAGTDQGVMDPSWLGCGWYDIAGNSRSPAIALRNS